MPPAAPHAPGDRIVTLDAVRGFALMGIIAVHMVEQYLGSPPPASRAALAMPAVDAVAGAITGLLFVGKFFAMFSLLFGVSFFIQMDRAAARGQAFEWRFTWRLAVLFAIGMAHHLVYRGDILAIYAALGLVLLLYYRVSDRWLLASAAVILLGGPRLLLALWATVSGHVPALMPDDASIQTYWNTLKGGSPAAIAWLNLTEGVWPKLQFLFSWFGRGYQTLGLFLIGLYLGRHRWHEQLDARGPSFKRLLWWSLAACGVVVLVAGSAFAAAAAAGMLPQGGEAPGPPQQAPPVWLLVGGFLLYDVFNLGAMGAMLAGFLLLFERPRARRVLRWFAPVGQTALTTYVTQSAAGGLIYYGYGLDLLGEIGAAAGLCLAAVVFAGQIVASQLWLRFFRYGPLEWLWRSLTFWKLQPLVRGGAPAIPEPA